MIKVRCGGLFELLRNAFVIILLLFWSVCLHSGNSFLSPFRLPRVLQTQREMARAAARSRVHARPAQASSRGSCSYQVAGVG